MCADRPLTLRCVTASGQAKPGRTVPVTTHRCASGFPRPNAGLTSGRPLRLRYFDPAGFGTGKLLGSAVGKPLGSAVGRAKPLGSAVGKPLGRAVGKPLGIAEGNGKAPGPGGGTITPPSGSFTGAPG